MSNSSPERTHALHEWQEEDELNLLLAVQAISQESVENYNPEINLFHRIEISLHKRLSYDVILSKIKELNQRFYKTRGLTESNFEVKRNKVFLISKDIWGRKQNNGEPGSKRSLENGNVEAEDEIKDAERTEMIETDVNEEGAQSGSGNETVDMEGREEDGQRNDTVDVEVEEEANNSQCGIGQMMSRDMLDVTVEMKDKEDTQIRGIENEMMGHKDKGTDFQRLRTVLLEKRKRQQNLESLPVNNKQTNLLAKKKQQHNPKSPPVNKKQKTGVKLYECGNLGDTASSCVQRKVVEHPTKTQETTDGTEAGQLEATTNKAVELSNESEPTRLETLSKEHTANKNLEEKSTISDSVSYRHTSDNVMAETSGKNNSETTDNKAVESSSMTKCIRSELLTKEHRANKNLEEKATISESGSYHPTSDDTKAETSGQFKSGTTNNNDVDSSNETRNIRSEPVAKDNKADKNFEEKTTISESCSCLHTPDNAKADAGNFKYKTTNKKGVESSNETKPLRLEPGSEENKSNKNSEEKVTISKSSSYHQTSEETSGNFKLEDHRLTLEQRKPPVNEPGSKNEPTSKKNSEEKSISLSVNGKQTSEQRNENEHSSNIPHDSTSEQRVKSHKIDSEVKSESLPTNCETVRRQSSHEHKKESVNSRQIETHHRYGQRHDEWRQYSGSRSPSVPHGHMHANSYHLTPSRKAEDVHRSQSVSRQYSFESLSPRAHRNYNTGYTPNNLRPNVSHLQGGGYHNQLMAQRAEYQYIQEQRMLERNNVNQNGYKHAYWHSYNGRDVGRYQSYATQQPPLPAEPFPYPPPPPPRTEPYWRR